MGSNDIVKINFGDCTDRLCDVLADVEINVDKIYIFSSSCGKLTENAEDEFVNAFSCDKELLLVYADEGYPSEVPWYKPDFSPDTLYSFFYIGNIFAVKGKALYNTDVSIYEMALKISDNYRFDHIPKVLFVNDNDDESKKLSGFENKALCKKPEAIQGNETVSVIIPSKDNSAVLEKCVTSLIELTEYKHYEIIVVDNGSCDTERDNISILGDKYGFEYIYGKQDFNFSKMCNIGAKSAKGEYLVFLNDDIEIVYGNWLYNMLISVTKSHVGAVGAKLYYPDYRIQHVGITNMGIGPAHKLCGSTDKNGEKNLYHGRNKANYNMLAVTGACLMVKRSIFENIGLFDETLPIAYNDVELCFRLYKAGHYNVIRNDAILIHHESLSRGEDTSPEKKKRLIGEKHKLYDKHPDMRAYDPFYSPNLVQWKWDSDYNENTIYDYDKEVIPTKLDANKLKALPKEHENKYIKKLTGENLLMLNIDGTDHIDSIENMYDKNMILIRGWVALRDKDNADASCRKWLLLKSTSNENEIYTLEIHPKPRKDVAELFDSKTQNATNSGINVFFDEKSLPKGKYIVGVLLKIKRQYIKWSTEIIDITR